jgi:transcription elongation factor S-II
MKTEAEYKTRMRTIIFNLKDKKNPELRRRVVLGEVSPEDLAVMSSEEMASSQKQDEIKRIRCALLFFFTRRTFPRLVWPLCSMHSSWAAHMKSPLKKTCACMYRAHMQKETKRSNNESGNITDMFMCGKCKKRRCTYYQMQTRSADEPMTTFVRCLECSHRWKFC